MYRGQAGKFLATMEVKTEEKKEEKSFFQLTEPLRIDCFEILQFRIIHWTIFYLPGVVYLFTHFVRSFGSGVASLLVKRF